MSNVMLGVLHFIISRVQEGAILEFDQIVSHIGPREVDGTKRSVMAPWGYCMGGRAAGKKEEGYNIHVRCRSRYSQQSQLETSTILL